MTAPKPVAPETQGGDTVATVNKTVAGPTLYVAGNRIKSWLGTMYDYEAERLAGIINAATAHRSDADTLRSKLAVATEALKRTACDCGAECSAIVDQPMTECEYYVCQRALAIIEGKGEGT